MWEQHLSAYPHHSSLCGGERAEPFGDFYDNASAFDVAMQTIEDGEQQAGLTRLQALYDYIVQMGEPKSTLYLLPAIAAMLATGDRRGVRSTQSVVKKVLSATFSWRLSMPTASGLGPFKGKSSGETIVMPQNRKGGFHEPRTG